MILGLIPARGGSKGVPGKNLREVAGKSLVARAAEVGVTCPSIDYVLVSTDSDEIAEAARAAGAEVPFMRPTELASDTASMLPVMQHAVNAVECNSGEQVELLVLLDPTGTLRVADDVEAAIRLLRETGCSAVISGHRAQRTPYFNMIEEVEGGFVQLSKVCAEEVGRRQDSPDVFDMNTVVWVYTRAALMEEACRLPERTRLYEVPAERALDLDTELDFEILEFLVARRDLHGES